VITTSFAARFGVGDTTIERSSASIPGVVTSKAIISMPRNPFVFARWFPWCTSQAGSADWRRFSESPPHFSPAKQFSRRAAFVRKTLERPSSELTKREVCISRRLARQATGISNLSIAILMMVPGAETHHVETTWRCPGFVDGSALSPKW